MLTKEQEKILRWLLALKANIKNTRIVINTMPEYPKEYTDKQLIQKLNELKDSDLITIKWYNQNHNELNMAIEITITEKGVKYFSDKNAAAKENIRRFVESHITAVMALIALVNCHEAKDFVAS